MNARVDGAESVSYTHLILRAIKELTQENISYTSDKGKTYDFNTADKLNTLLVNALVSDRFTSLNILAIIGLRGLE